MQDIRKQGALTTEAGLTVKLQQVILLHDPVRWEGGGDEAYDHHAMGVVVGFHMKRDEEWVLCYSNCGLWGVKANQIVQSDFF